MILPTTSLFWGQGRDLLPCLKEDVLIVLASLSLDLFSEFKRVIRIASARLATFEGLLVLIKDISSLQFTKITKLLFNLKVGL